MGYSILRKNMFFTVDSKTRNDLEQAGTTWKELELLLFLEQLLLNHLHFSDTLLFTSSHLTSALSIYCYQLEGLHFSDVHFSDIQ